MLAVREIKITGFLLRFTSNLFRVDFLKNVQICYYVDYTDPFNLIHDKIIKFIDDDATNLNNF